MTRAGLYRGLALLALAALTGCVMAMPPAPPPAPVEPTEEPALDAPAADGAGAGFDGRGAPRHEQAGGASFTASGLGAHAPDAGV